MFQIIPVSATKEIISDEKSAFCVSSIISALLFSLAHGIYGKYYIIYAFIAGIILALAYNLADYRKEKSFLSVFAIHSLWNLSVLLLL